MAPLAVTPREREVLQLIARGFTMKESATMLGITPRTVAFHKYRMMQQLKVSSTAELVKLALRHGIE
jgi:DNA-binding CsgD family transcriptional regulator